MYTTQLLRHAADMLGTTEDDPKVVFAQWPTEVQYPTEGYQDTLYRRTYFLEDSRGGHKVTFEQQPGGLWRRYP